MERLTGKFCYQVRILQASKGEFRCSPHWGDSSVWEHHLAERSYRSQVLIAPTVLHYKSLPESDDTNSFFPNISFNITRSFRDILIVNGILQ